VVSEHLLNTERRILGGFLEKLDLSVLVGLNLLIFKIGLLVNTDKKPLLSIRAEDS